MTYFGDNAANAWCDINMTGTAVLNDNFNCDSVTDHAEGEVTITFTTDFGGSNYCAVQHSENHEGTNSDSQNVASGVKGASHRQAGSFRFDNIRLRFDQQPPQKKDTTHCSWAFFGDQ